MYFGVIVTLPEVLWSSVPQCGETRQTLAGTEQAAPACASLPLESACRLAAAPGGGRADLTHRGRGLSGMKDRRKVTHQEVRELGFTPVLLWCSSSIPKEDMGSVVGHFLVWETEDAGSPSDFAID